MEEGGDSAKSRLPFLWSRGQGCVRRSSVRRIVTSEFSDFARRAHTAKEKGKKRAGGRQRLRKQLCQHPVDSDMDTAAAASCAGVVVATNEQLTHHDNHHVLRERTSALLEGQTARHEWSACAIYHTYTTIAIIMSMVRYHDDGCCSSVVCARVVVSSGG